MECYIVTDLLNSDGAYRYNAVYAFKSMTSVKSYKKYLDGTGCDHRVVVATVTVPDGVKMVQVITEFETVDNLPQYKATTVMEDWEDARDYVENVRENQPTVETEHDSVKIHSRFTPDMLHCGWAEF